MTPNELISERLNRIESVPLRFINGVSSIQSEIFAELVTILGQLNIGESFILNDANLLRIDELMNQYYEALKNGKYGSYVAWILQEMDRQKGLIDAFSELEYGAIAGRAADAAYTSTKSITTRLLIGDDFKTNFINVVRDNLIQSIDGDASFEEMVKNMNALFVDDERLPQMVNWTSQVSSDRFAVADRTYGDAVAQDLGLQFFQYLGGLIKDSREFCVKRNGDFFHRLEAQDWVSLQWQGKFRQTNEQNVLHWLGGYRCQHSPVFRSLISVPKEVIQRNIANGNYKPTQAERALLGLS